MITLKPLAPRGLPPPAKTFSDYAATAVCPVLIMLAVGSVIFFLLALGYGGSHSGALHWTFFWFVMAMVLVSRIAIEKGSEHAGLYGLALALATAFMLVRYVEFNIWAFCLLGVIWWATNKLTWDCTVIDDDEDASGEGLLQASKLAPTPVEKAAVPAPQPASGAARKPQKKVHWWDKEPGQGRRAARKPHAPGMWVIYFSLGALAIFGLGQGFLPRRDPGVRFYTFCLLVLYLAAALGLLLISSFLGLRRYLRQRYIQMPAAMASTWVSLGVLLIAAILAGCVLLPRPQASWSLPAMLSKLGDPLARKDAGTGDSKTRARGAAQRAGAPSEPSTGNPSEPGAEQPPSNAGKAPEAGQSPARAQRPNGAEQSGGGSAPSAAPNPSSMPVPAASLNLLQTVVYAVLLVIGLVVVIRARKWLLGVLAELWRSLRDLWLSLFRRKTTQPVAPSQRARPGAPQRFAALVNPFDSGAAERMPVEELVVQSFNGLEAWAQEHQCGRQPEQTPYEFAQVVAGTIPGLANEAQEVAQLYVQVAYAKGAVLPACRTVLEILWSKMTRGMD